MGKEIITKLEPKNEQSSPLNNINDGKKVSKEEKEKLKNRNRKLRQKGNRKIRKSIKPEETLLKEDNLPSQTPKGVEIEYVERDEYLLTGKYYEEFKNVFQYFATPKIEKGSNNPELEETSSNNEENSMQFENEAEAKEPIKKIKEIKLSRKKRKQLKMLKVAQLKALVKRPDVVEV